MVFERKFQREREKRVTLCDATHQRAFKARVCSAPRVLALFFSRALFARVFREKKTAVLQSTQTPANLVLFCLEIVLGRKLNVHVSAYKSRLRNWRISLKMSWNLILEHPSVCAAGQRYCIGVKMNVYLRVCLFIRKRCACSTLAK